MPGLRITPGARDDLTNIGRYTLRVWGELQRDHYLRNLDQRFAWLAQNPRPGKHRPDIQEGYHCIPQGQHLVFFTLQEDGIAIIGVPHQDMDMSELLQRLNACPAGVHR